MAICHAAKVNKHGWHRAILALPEMTRPAFRERGTQVFFHRPPLPKSCVPTKDKTVDVERNVCVMEFLWQGLLSITWQQAVMYVVQLL